MSIKRYSPWWDNSPTDFVLQSQLPLYADVVIIGAGFAGISTAFWLARLTKRANRKKPYRIMVLDKAPHPAFKSSGRMTGSVYLGSNKNPKAVVEDIGKSKAKALYQYSHSNNELLESLVSKMPCDAEFNGGLRMASSAQEASDLFHSQDLLIDWGFYPVYFDHNKSQHLAINPLAKSSLFIPNEGMIDPFAFTNHIARVLRQNNVWIVYGSKVTGTSFTENYGPQLELENGHVITAGKVVHTSVDTIPDDRLLDAVTYRRETCIFTEPFSEDILDDMPLPLMPIELNNGSDSVRLHDRSLMISGGRAAVRAKDPEIGQRNDSSFNQRILDQLDSTMVRNFPFSNHGEISHAWTYIETESKDGLPLVGQLGQLPDNNSHYVNVAYGRNKFGLAFLGSKNLAERILRSAVKNSEFSIFNPKRLT